MIHPMRALTLLYRRRPPIPAQHEAKAHIEKEQGIDSWQYKVLQFVHQSWVQNLLACLLFLDVCILFAELALLTIYPTCNLVERDAISCCPMTEGDNDDHHRFLAGSDHHYCGDGLKAMKDYEAGCDSHKWHNVHVAEKYLISVTLAILSLFFLELVLTMAALTPKVFFRQLFYALDFFIVAVSLGVEIVFVIKGDEISASLFGLVILARVWRFVRIGHGIVELAEDMAHERELHLSAYIDELEGLLKKNSVALPDDDLAAVAHGHANCELLERLEETELEKAKKHLHKSSIHTSDAEEGSS